MLSLQRVATGFVPLATKNHRCYILLPNSDANLPFKRKISNIQRLSEPSSGMTRGDNNNEKGNVEESSNKQNKISSTTLPISSVILGIVAFRSLIQLFLPTEIPGVFFAGTNAPTIDYIATAFDLFFVGYGAKNLLDQTGVLRKVGKDPVLDTRSMFEDSFAGLECRVTLNIGREQGTWMDKEWAASGSRLAFPVNLRFSKEEIDLGIPGEEALGGRFCNRLETPDGIATFVGPNGEVKVRVEGGCWAILPITERIPQKGGWKLRFFLDFPDGASRNDVTLPAGRVFFSGTCFNEATSIQAEIGDKLLVGPSNIGIFPDGGLTIKKNNLLNFYGAFGDTNLMLGRYTVEKIY